VYELAPRKLFNLKETLGKMTPYEIKKKFKKEEGK
jgi:hypothetical protein